MFLLSGVCTLTKLQGSHPLRSEIDSLLAPQPESLPCSVADSDVCYEPAEVVLEAVDFLQTKEEAVLGGAEREDVVGHYDDFGAFVDAGFA